MNVSHIVQIVSAICGEKRRCLYMPVMFFSLLSMVPRVTENIRVINSVQGFTIKIHKISPAYAALEDVRTISTMSASEIVTNSEELVAGERFDDQSIRQSTDPEPKLEAPSDFWVRLSGMKVTQNDNVNDMDYEKVENHQKIAKLDRSSIQPANVIQPKRRKVEPSMYADDGQLLPLEIRTQLLANYYSDQFDFQVTGVQQKAQELVQRELATIPPVMRRPPKGAKNKKTPPAQATENIVTPSPIQFVALSGRLQMKDGLAYLGEDTHLKVYWTIDGEIIEEARVSLLRGEYEIVVDRLEGYLVAEYRSAEGDLLGEAEVSLYELANNEAQTKAIGDRINNVHLYVGPVEQGLVVNMVSGRSFEEKEYREPKTDVRVVDIDRKVAADDEELFRDKSFHNGSTYLMQGELKNHWGSLAVGISQTRKRVEIFPNSMIEALLDLSGQKKDGAIVWGRVVADGKVVSGAEVELAGEASRPIYFNAYVPSHRLSATGSNGWFAFVGVTPGIQAVRVRYQGQVIVGEIIPVEMNKVSYSQIDLGRSRIASVKVKDGLTKDDVPSRLNFVGSDQTIDYIPGELEQVKFPGGKGLMWVEADGGPLYDVTRTNVKRNTRHLEIPLVRMEWLERLAQDRRINRNPETGILVGYVAEGKYSVFFSDLGEELQENLVFFDDRGQIVKDHVPVSGGGFALFNIPIGYRTIALLPNNSKEILSRIFVAEPEVVNVIEIK